MKVIVECLRQWTVELERNVSDSNGQEYFTWVFGLPFCAMRYNNKWH